MEHIEKINVELARHDERIKDLEEWRNDQSRILGDIQKELKQLGDDFKSRPTWSVTVVLTILSTLCGSLIVYIVTHV